MGGSHLSVILGYQNIAHLVSKALYFEHHQYHLEMMIFRGLPFYSPSSQEHDCARLQSELSKCAAIIVNLPIESEAFRTFRYDTFALEVQYKRF
ncbi:MAG: hypothetical protein OEZ47_16760, partial [Gammaproteobacteria bacterium]|nr:hypothetical protein [Gammaproteobacteria bacterium]